MSQTTVMPKLLLVAEIDEDRVSEEKAQEHLDSFRESILPSVEWGISFYRATEEDLENVIQDPQNPQWRQVSGGPNADAESRSLELVLVDAENEHILEHLNVDLLSIDPLSDEGKQDVIDSLMEAFGGGDAGHLYRAGKIYMATYCKDCSRSKFQGVRPILDMRGTAQTISTGLPFQDDQVEELQEALDETKKEFLYS